MLPLRARISDGSTARPRHLLHKFRPSASFEPLPTPRLGEVLGQFRKHGFSEVGPFFLVLLPLAGQKKTFNLENTKILKNNVSTTNACCLRHVFWRICFLHKKSCTSQNAPYVFCFKNKLPHFDSMIGPGAQFRVLEKRKWAPGTVEDQGCERCWAGTCDVCVCGVACLWRVLWSVNCV